MIPFAHRFEIIKNIKCVDNVIAEHNWEQKISDIKKYDVDILAMGDDWEGKFDSMKEYCEVIYLKRTKDISSSFLKKSLSNFLSIPKEVILNALDVLSQ